MKQIKNKIVITLLLLVGLQGILSAELLRVRKIKMQNIAYHAKRIKQLLFIHQAAKISLFTISSIANVVELFRFLHFLYSLFLSDSLTKFSNIEKIIKEQADKKMVNVSLLNHWKTKLKNLVYSKEFWHAILFGSSTIATEKIREIVDHPNTMEWLLSKKISCKNTFENIYMYAKLLTHVTLAAEEKTSYKETIHYLCNKLVKQVEEVVGFIKYKKAQMQNDEQQEVKKIANYLVSCTNKWVTANNNLLSADYFEVEQFLLLIANYKKELRRELNRFSCIEEEIGRIVL